VGMSLAPTHGVPHQWDSAAWEKIQQRSKLWSSTRAMPNYVTHTPRRKALLPPTWRVALTATQAALIGR